MVPMVVTYEVDRMHRNCLHANTQLNVRGDIQMGYGHLVGRLEVLVVLDVLHTLICAAGIVVVVRLVDCNERGNSYRYPYWPHFHSVHCCPLSQRIPGIVHLQSCYHSIYVVVVVVCNPLDDGDWEWIRSLYVSRILSDPVWVLEVALFAWIYDSNCDEKVSDALDALDEDPVQNVVQSEAVVECDWGGGGREYPHCCNVGDEWVGVRNDDAIGVETETMMEIVHCDSQNDCYRVCVHCGEDCGVHCH